MNGIDIETEVADHRGRRVLHLIASADRRGAETYAYEIVGRLRELNRDDQLFALMPGGPDSLPVSALASSTHSPSILPSLLRRRNGISLIVAHGSTTLLWAYLLNRIAGTPFVYRQISDPSMWVAPRAQRRVGRELHAAQRIVALSDSAVDALTARYDLPRSVFAVIPNSADERRFHPTSAAERSTERGLLNLPDSARVVGFLGAIRREKGVYELLEACCAIPDCWLVAGGTGPELGPFITRAVSTLGGRFRYLGETDRPESVHRASDVLALPSYTEWQPAVIIEAELCGTPVVATDVGDVKSLLSERSLLVSPRDAEALSRAITSLFAGNSGVLGAAREPLQASPAAPDRLHRHVTGAQQWSDLLDSAVRR